MLPIPLQHVQTDETDFPEQDTSSSDLAQLISLRIWTRLRAWWSRRTVFFHCWYSVVKKRLASLAIYCAVKSLELVLHELDVFFAAHGDPPEFCRGLRFATRQETLRTLCSSQHLCTTAEIHTTCNLAHLYTLSQFRFSSKRNLRTSRENLGHRLFILNLVNSCHRNRAPTKWATVNRTLLKID